MVALIQPVVRAGQLQRSRVRGGVCVALRQGWCVAAFAAEEGSYRSPCRTLSAIGLGTLSMTPRSKPWLPNSEPRPPHSNPDPRPPGTLSMLVVKSDKKKKKHYERVEALRTFSDANDLPDVSDSPPTPCTWQESWQPPATACDRHGGTHLLTTARMRACMHVHMSLLGCWAPGGRGVSTVVSCAAATTP